MTDKITQEQILTMKSRFETHQKKINKLIMIIKTSKETSSVFWSKINRQIKSEFNDIKWIFKDFSTRIIEREFGRSLKDIVEKMNSFKNIKKYQSILIYKELVYKEFKKTDRIVNMLANQKKIALTDFYLGLDSGEKKINGLIRGTQQKLIEEKAINNTIEKGLERPESRTWQNSMKLLKDSLLEKGNIITILCRDGKIRNYDVGKYAEMVVRSRIRESETNQTKLTAVDLGTDLVQVSAHNTTCNICAQYEGKIFSIGGVSKDFPKLSEEPPYHPKCKHLLIIQFREVLELRGIEQYTAFSNGKIEKPPYIPSFVPIKERKLS